MRLTRGEAWWLWRRRLGATQAAFARTLGVSVDRLRARELDRSPAPLFAIEPAWGCLTPGEFSTICRRRAGYSIERMARWLDVSVTTAKRMERDRVRTASRMARWWMVNGTPRARAAAPVRIPGPARNVCRSTEDRGGRPRSPIT